MSERTTVISFFNGFFQTVKHPCQRGELGSSISSDPYEEAGELSQSDAVCSKGDLQDLGALACTDRALGFFLSAAQNLFMEPVEEIDTAGPFPNHLLRVERGLEALLYIASGVQAYAWTELLIDMSDQRHSETIIGRWYCYVNRRRYCYLNCRRQAVLCKSRVTGGIVM